jgi:hypothetical protein
MRKISVLFISLALIGSASASAAESGQKFAVVLTLVSIMISLPAFVSLYIHIKKTNLGKVLFQPLLAMFIGFFGIMLNSLIQIWNVFNGYEVNNRDLLMGLNSAISTVLIAAGAVMMFFAVKKTGLLPMEYYQKKEQEREAIEPAVLQPAVPKTTVPKTRKRSKV